ncbi:hypothetical protein GCM10011396_16990 [Undibacterium terreum]|uniref:Uncharacterized protein n=1 Tax=Undibacterium terreum TaxID=1224302 RepID=A0A916XGK0_9BURK|nr:hypothetical protein GCM10011396_16990 [Undibacterium terreum]
MTGRLADTVLQAGSMLTFRILTFVKCRTDQLYFRAYTKIYAYAFFKKSRLAKVIWNYSWLPIQALD